MQQSSVDWLDEATWEPYRGWPDSSDAYINRMFGPGQNKAVWEAWKHWVHEHPSYFMGNYNSLERFNKFLKEWASRRSGRRAVEQTSKDWLDEVTFVPYRAGDAASFGSLDAWLRHNYPRISVDAFWHVWATTPGRTDNILDDFNRVLYMYVTKHDGAV